LNEEKDGPFLKLSTAYFKAVDRLDPGWCSATIRLYLSTHEMMSIDLERLVPAGCDVRVASTKYGSIVRRIIETNEVARGTVIAE
jgi:hypothetical protein